MLFRSNCGLRIINSTRTMEKDIETINLTRLYEDILLDNIEKDNKLIEELLRKQSEEEERLRVEAEKKQQEENAKQDQVNSQVNYTNG